MGFTHHCSPLEIKLSPWHSMNGWLFFHYRQVQIFDKRQFTKNPAAGDRPRWSDLPPDT
jgi:hypothetical protein